MKIPPIPRSLMIALALTCSGPALAETCPAGTFEVSRHETRTEIFVKCRCDGGFWLVDDVCLAPKQAMALEKTRAALDLIVDGALLSGMPEGSILRRWAMVQGWDAARVKRLIVSTLNAARTMNVRPGATDRALELTARAFRLLDGADLEQLAASHEDLAKPGSSDEVYAGKKVLYDATKAFREAHGAAPWWPDGLYNLAVMNAAIGTERDAISLMRRYLEIEPDHVSPRAARAAALIEQWQDDHERYFDARK